MSEKMTKINRLVWDSEFFNLEVGDFDLEDSTIPDCTDFDLIYIKSIKKTDFEIKGFVKTYTETKIIFRKVLNNLNFCISSKTNLLVAFPFIIMLL